MKTIFLNCSNTFAIFDQPCSEERLNYLFIMAVENHRHMKRTKGGSAKCKESVIGVRLEVSQNYVFEGFNDAYVTYHLF